MAKKDIPKETMEALLYGSLILGAGGGGSLSGGRETIEAAYKAGTPTMISVEDLDPSVEGHIVTTSAVGAPAAKEQFAKPADFNRIMERMALEVEEPLLAYITNELGAGSTFNAFIQSATTGIPMLDAACNGRAHPLGTMGSMGLSEKPDYETIQTAVGGNPALGKYIELTVKGSVSHTSALVRAAAVEAGGLVVVARNPVSLDYVKEHAALGVLTQATEVGRAFLSGETPEKKLANAAEALGGEVLFEGMVSNFDLRTEGGLDVGSFEVTDKGSTYTMYIWNEYMACDKDGTRIWTFPDLLMTFDTHTGEPITSAALKSGQHIRVLAVPRAKIRLGAGMYEQSGYERIEDVLNIDMVSYLPDLFA